MTDKGMPDKIWASEAKAGYGEWQDTKDGMPVPLPYIRADIVEELVGALEGMYGRHVIYCGGPDLPFAGHTDVKLFNESRDALSRINAIMEGKCV